MKTIFRIFIFILLLVSEDTAAQVNTAPKTLQADFRQTKTMKMLGDKLVSQGKMYYSASDKLRWEYTSPYTYTFIMNGQKVLLKKGGRKDVVDTSKNKMFREIGKVMMNSLVVTSTKQQMDLPQTKQMKSLYKRIVIYFNQKTHLVERVVMYEKNGDQTDIELKNVTTNKNIAAGMFTVQ